MYIFFVIGICAVTIRVILDSYFGHSALLYVAVPFLVSFLLFQVTEPVKPNSPLRRYVGHLRNATIVMLSTSAILFEGFICVLFFMPIYYAVVTLGFLFDALMTRHRERQTGKLQASLIPVVVSILAIEGVTPYTSFSRENTITRTIVVDESVETLKANMAAPIALPEKRNWFLSIFPLPVDVQAGSLSEGDVHTLDFVYKRWFFTNNDYGQFQLRIDEVGDDVVRTSVVKDSSYFSKYLDLQGTEVTFRELSDGRTEVSLTVFYNRLLDPSWYFGPLQRSAVSLSADYLIESVITRRTVGS
ncbi:MAG: hypothetical protein AAGH41_10540 [Pseudomonadota bacterium]